MDRGRHGRAVSRGVIGNYLQLQGANWLVINSNCASRVLLTAAQGEEQAQALEDSKREITF